MKVTDEMIDTFGNSVWAHPWTDAGQTELSRSEVRDALQAVLDLIEGRVIVALDAIDSGDPEKAHGDAEVAIIGAFANQESESFSNKVGKAWDRAADRVGGFWYA